MMGGEGDGGKGSGDNGKREEDIGKWREGERGELTKV